MADVTVQQLLNLDSTNLNPHHWVMLIDAIAADQDNYDGIIVTHGTDTMAYTASAVSFAFGRGLQKPIVFTGAQLPLIEQGTDARFNLENAVKATIKAIEENIAEVMIVFSDYILRGNRTIKTSESKFRAFDSPAFPHLGSISAVGISFSPLALEAGAISTGDLTDVAAQVKCMWALDTWSRSKEDFKKLMASNVVGEKS